MFVYFNTEHFLQKEKGIQDTCYIIYDILYIDTVI
jgi:hypothetical protein